MLLVLTIPTHTHTNKVKKSKPNDEANKSNARMTLFKFTADIPGHIITCLTLSVGTLFSSLYFKCVLYELFSFPQLALENRAIFCFIFPRILCCCPKISSLTYKCPWSTARDVQHSFCQFQFVHGRYLWGLCYPPFCIYDQASTVYIAWAVLYTVKELARERWVSLHVMPRILCKRPRWKLVQLVLLVWYLT